MKKKGKNFLDSWFEKGQKRPSKHVRRNLLNMKFPKNVKGFGMGDKGSKGF